MDQNKIETTNNEVTFVDILRMFRGKLKVLICIALIAAAVGAVAGVAITALGATYGGEITFYLVPSEYSQSLLPILKSESFAEKLLLDENGLPPREYCDASDYDAALKAVLAQKDAADKALSLKKELDAYPYTMAPIQEKHDILYNERTRIYNLLQMYKSAQDEIANQPGHSEKIAEYEEKLQVADEAWKKYKEEFFDPMVAAKMALEEESYHSFLILKDARELSYELVDKTLVAWREDEEVQKLVSLIQQSVTYEYVKLVEDPSASGQDLENQNPSFLVITVAVKRNEEMAQQIIEMVKERTPSFVEGEIRRINGILEADCKLTSTFVEASYISEESLIKNVVLFGVLGAALGIALYCVVVIVKNLLPEDLFPKKEKKNKKKAENNQ